MAAVAAWKKKNSFVNFSLIKYKVCWCLMTCLGFRSIFPAAKVCTCNKTNPCGETIGWYNYVCACVCVKREREKEFTVCDVWFEGKGLGKEKKRKSYNFYSEFQLDNQNQTFSSFFASHTHTHTSISHLHVVVKMWHVRLELKATVCIKQTSV